MKITIDNEEKLNFYENLKKIKIHVEIESKGRLRFGGKYHEKELHRKEYVIFAGTKIEHKELLNYFNIIENRYQLARYCLYELSKECKNISFRMDRVGFVGRIINKIELFRVRRMNRKLKEQNVSINFQILSEYFIFAISSCLDTMSHIINIIYHFRIPPYKVHAYSVYGRVKRKRDRFSRYFLKDWKNWIDEFRTIRNRMAHHEIIRFSTTISHDVQNNKAEYNNFSISVNYNNKDVTKKLPFYFRDILSNYEKFLLEFYKKLNTIPIETL